MIKRYAEAKILHDALMRANADIKDARNRIWQDLTCPERHRVHEAVTHILEELYVEGIRPLRHKHSALVPEDDL